MFLDKNPLGENAQSCRRTCLSNALPIDLSLNGFRDKKMVSFSLSLEGG